ncbi:MAG TPA: peptidylprolyl isomerase, partial [Dehalococcoidia bacterium]|nr:peptidylprolyl isomerase [Dehalococcoidia bacterium]
AQPAAAPAAADPAPTSAGASPAAAGPTGGENKVQYSKYPDMVIDPNKSYKAVIETDKGNLELDLFAKDAPKTVNNFVFLAREGFYDNVVFHRVIDGFMAQGGDPTGTGTGGPGYKFEDEINQHKVGAGALAMANAGPNTNGSQFFITYAPQPHLDGKHTVFGQLTAGQDVLRSLNKVQPGQPGGTPSVIKTIRVTES